MISFKKIKIKIKSGFIVGNLVLPFNLDVKKMKILRGGDKDKRERKDGLYNLEERDMLLPV